MLDAHIKSMMHSPRHNYVIPGLTSWLIGAPSAMGCVRLFTMSRTHEEPIVPHSHRFAFVCRVLTGRVENRTWFKTSEIGDLYQASDVTYEGVFGKHVLTPLDIAKYSFAAKYYGAAAEYGMKAKEIHSIYFQKGSEVLFFEGPPTEATSQVIEPVVNGKVIPLMKTEPWMFSTE